jgi:hypothetical protein
LARRATATQRFDSRNYLITLHKNNIPNQTLLQDTISIMGELIDLLKDEKEESAVR